MRIIEQAVTEQVEVYYQATDDAGDYSRQHTYVVPGKLPTVAKARAAWDAERAKEIAADYAAWNDYMHQPISEPTKADLEAQLVREQANLAESQRKIVSLTAAVAAADAKRG